MIAGRAEAPVAVAPAPDLLPLPEHAHVVVVGTGFAGIGMTVALLEEGFHDVIVLERAGDIGGTWRDNSYPGCACDVPSHLYSYSFAPNPNWTRTFSAQPEILDYIRSVADQHGVRPHVRFGAELLEAAWDEPAGHWRIRTARGSMTATVLISGMGALSDPAVPHLPGLESFAGSSFHSATWDHEVELAGRRVAVVGTGASAIQFVPQIAPQVAQLTLFQRTPPWILPRPDRAVTAMERRVYRRLPAAQRAMRGGIYWARELLVLGFTGKVNLLKAAQRRAAGHLAKQVPDPVLRAKLTPDYALGCKRMLLSSDYYPALCRPNVEVVDTGIEQVLPDGIRTTDGTVHEADVIIFGTGFLVTEMPIGQRVRGRAGELLDDVWKGSPSAYLGATVTGFPNLFLLVGPNTGLGHSSMIYMIEAQVAYTLDALRQMRDGALAVVDVLPRAQESFNEELQARMATTVWTTGGCKSWYLDASGRNRTLWPDFTFRFRRRTSRFDRSVYDVSMAAPSMRTPVDAG